MDTETNTEDFTEIVSTGISFIRAINAHYGSEKGLELWNNISETLGDEIRGKIFFSLLTGENEDTVIIKALPGTTNKISSIKTIRQYTGLGLLESKLAYESSEYKTVSVKILEPKRRHDMINELHNAGMIAR